MSRDEGQTWTEISPDLTRNDKAKQEKSGGPITHDDTGIEVYDTIFYVAESPHEAGVIWAGTDDGLVQLTRDGGKTWQNVTPKGLPEWIRVNAIEISPHDKATCYVAATMYQFDDFKPYLYKTNDYGKTWTKIVHGIPDNVFTRVVREDSVPPGPAVRRNRVRPLRLVRRRRELAAVPTESAGRPRHRPRRQGLGSRRRDAGPSVLDPRRPDAAAPVPGHDSRRRAAGLSSAADVSFSGKRRTRRRGGKRRSRREESPRRRPGLLLAQEEAQRDREADDRVPRRRQGAPSLLEREEGEAGRGRSRETARTSLSSPKTA